jgi:hypothetical protein
MNKTFGIGNVLATGFRIWAKNFIPFLLITVLLYSPLWIWGISCAQSVADNESLHGLVVFEKFSPLLSWSLYLLTSAALTYGVVMELQGQHASLGACLSRWLTRLLPTLGTLVILALCFCGLSVLLVGLVELIGGWVALVIWFTLLLWVSSILYVATQASVFEQPGSLGALGRSRALTKGHRFALAILVILIVLLLGGLQSAIQALTLPNFALYVYLNLARSMLVGSLASVMAGVAYYLLRAEKEGTNAAELAAVFD